MVLLYVDVLGMKDRWQNGGPAVISEAHRQFELIIRHALRASTEAAASATGGIQSDAAALFFDDAECAVTVGRHIFRESFRRGDKALHSRYWMRGVIIPVDSSETDHTDQLTGAASGLFRRTLSPGVLEAIHVEQSGFRGHRLIIHDSLCNRELVRAFSVTIRDRKLKTVTKLEHCKKVDSYSDVLWMFPQHHVQKDWPLMQRAMNNRLRWAGERSSQEFVHAAATQLLFSECQAIYAKLGTNSRRQPRLRDRRA